MQGSNQLDEMPTAKEFLEDFCRDLVAHTDNRPAIIAGYAKHMEAREQAIAEQAKQEAAN